MSGGVSDQNKVKLTVKTGNPFSLDGVLAPLSKTGNGVVFPYSPTIQISHNANYGNFDITHGMYPSNYYINTPNPTISLTALFTCNTIDETAYSAAALQFFKACTKSDFGEQRRATAGTPPPILNFSAYGTVHAKLTPVVISGFGYTLTEDVDYVEVDAGPAGIISMPTQWLASLELSVQFPPSSVRKDFNLKDYASGNLLKGYL